MTPERWRQVTSVFHRALARSPEARARFLDEACGSDRELRGEVEGMIAAAGAAAGFGERPIADETRPVSRLATGTAIGPYRIHELVGAGGMGEVYRARDTELERDVAIKVLPTHLLHEPERQTRLAREARVLALLNHPNIAAIYGLVRAPAELALILEFVEGVTLAEQLAAGGPLPVAEALQIARQIAVALDVAHRRGIVHRDLKPANIKITPIGHVKVLDFGLAKALGEDLVAEPFRRSEPTALSTADGVIVGSPAYMSPEQVRGARLDERTDIWSFGCVVHEVLTGSPAFASDSVPQTLARILDQEPESVGQRRPDVPRDVERVLAKCLQKDPRSRYASAAELVADVEACERRLGGRATAVLTALRRPAVLAPTIALAGAAVVVASVLLARVSRERWARQEVIPRIETLAEAGEWEAAYTLAKSIEKAVSAPMLAELWPRISWSVAIPSDPPGARVFRRAYAGDSPQWEELGTTPLEGAHLPFGYSVMRFERPGHRPLVRALGFATEGSQQLMRLDPVKLDTRESLPEGFVRVAGRPPEFAALGMPAQFRDYFLGRHEVTNREYKRFVDAGGYQRREFWEHPFVRAHSEIPWEAGMSLLTDRTGRPGPSGWAGGDYPQGLDEHPVGGVSWYEAAAYAKFAGRELPTIHHWRFALTQGGASIGSEVSWILPASNLDGDGPVRVGQFDGVAWSGAYDMIGNVREWCVNAAGDKRVIAGGGWSDESAYYNPAHIEVALSPLDRSAANGFRLAIADDEPATAARLREPVPDAVPRTISASPTSNEAFEIYRRMYAYDRAPLNARIEGRESSRYWVRERVTIDNSYGERTIVYVYLPVSGSRPYQTLVYSPGAIANFIDSIDQYRAIHVDFLLKSGRAVAFPVYKGTFERRERAPLQGPNVRRQRLVQMVNDLRRTVDYLETRAEVDAKRLGYYGYSTFYGPMYLVVEPRLRTGVFYLAALPGSQLPPEADPRSFLPRVGVPVLMLSGELDSVFPLEALAKPFFQALGTSDKRHVIAGGGHFVPRQTLIREMLDWLERYLGPVKPAPTPVGAPGP